MASLLLGWGRGEVERQTSELCPRIISNRLEIGGIVLANRQRWWQDEDSLTQVTSLNCCTTVPVEVGLCYFSYFSCTSYISVSWIQELTQLCNYLNFLNIARKSRNI
jgi:hypothetical protein